MTHINSINQTTRNHIPANKTLKTYQKKIKYKLNNFLKLSLTVKKIKGIKNRIPISLPKNL